MSSFVMFNCNYICITACMCVLVLSCASEFSSLDESSDIRWLVSVTIMKHCSGKLLPGHIIDLESDLRAIPDDLRIRYSTKKHDSHLVARACSWSRHS